MRGTTSHKGDETDLASFGYKQELHRSLGFFSSFAAAFSYISPSTGIFTLFSLGLITVGGVFIWSWPIVAAGQFVIALNFAEISSHFPLAGSVFQWTKYLAGRPYAWFTGWIYLVAGILTTTAVLVTFPLAFVPAMQEMGWKLSGSLSEQRYIALILLVVVLVLNIFSVKLVAFINNTGVLFEILGMVVFALILLIFHHHQSISIVTNSGGLPVNFGSFFARHVHELVRHLRLRYRIDARRRDERPEADGAPRRPRLGGRRLRDRRHLPARPPHRHPQPERGDRRRLRPGVSIIEANFSKVLAADLSARSFRPPSSSAACAS